jgi:hypothetical protein
MSSTESSSVILKTPDNWDAWNKQFKAEAKRKKLLEQVEGTATFRTEPKEPDLKKFLPQTRGSGSSTAASSTAASSTTEAGTPEPTTADLATEGRANFQLAYTIYKDQRDQYDNQQDSLNKLQTWMTKTVASSYVETCFNYEKGHQGLVMAKGQERNLSFATNVDEWFEDFLATANTIEPTWTKVYRLAKSAEVESGTLSYQTLANDFRKAV